MGWLDDDGDLIAVAVDEPVEGHVELVINNQSNKNRNNNCSGDKQSNSQTHAMVRPPIITPSAIWGISAIGDQGHRFDLRFLRAFRADLSIKKSSSFFPPLIAAASQRGFAPRPAQVSPDGPRYLGRTFLPFNTLPLPRTTLRPPTTAMLPNCVSISARRLRRASSTRFRRSMSASMVIPDRFIFGIVISGTLYS